MQPSIRKSKPNDTRKMSMNHGCFVRPIPVDDGVRVYNLEVSWLQLSLNHSIVQIDERQVTGSEIGNPTLCGN